MPKQTGTYTNAKDLLSQMRTFAAANGYTVNYYGVYATSTAYDHLSLEKGGKYFNIIGGYAGHALGTYEIFYFALATGYTPGAGIADQPGSSYPTIPTAVNYIDTPVTPRKYWFYIGPNYFNGAFEIEGPGYKHFGFGELDKIGSYTGGEYCLSHSFYLPQSRSYDFATTANIIGTNKTTYDAYATVVRTDLTGTPSYSRIINTSISGGQGTIGPSGVFSVFENSGSRNPTITTSKYTMPPVMLLVYPGTTAYLSPVGYIPGLKGMRMGADQAPLKEQVIATNWRCFPLTAIPGESAAYNRSYPSDNGVAHDESV